MRKNNGKNQRTERNKDMDEDEKKSVRLKLR